MRFYTAANTSSHLIMGGLQIDLICCHFIGNRSRKGSITIKAGEPSVTDLVRATSPKETLPSVDLIRLTELSGNRRGVSARLYVDDFSQ